MKRCVIVSGAEIENYGIVKTYLRSDDYNIFCDCGLRHRQGLGAEPQLIVGDFDSYEKPKTDIETISLPCEKDDTDTVFAVKEGLRRGYEEFLIVGAIGQRLDHSLGNLYILNMLEELGKKGVIVDDYSEMELVGRQPVYIEDKYSYFSLVNISGTAEGIFIEGAKYPLADAEIKCTYQYGISNEVTKGGRAKVWVDRGSLLLIKVR